MVSKLIRDYVPEAFRAEGRSAQVRKASETEVPGLLAAKLSEECGEVLAAGPDRILEELADVVEVAYAIAALHGYSIYELSKVRRAKASTDGTFTERFVLTLTEREK